MRFLGIDYGTKRIGLAISDENCRLAFPLEIVLNDKNTVDRIGEIIDEKNITDIVMGESVDFKGALNALSARIDVFIIELTERFFLPIHKQKEFLTSVEARKSTNTKASLTHTQVRSRVKQIKSGRIDASAAALILQRYLDKKNNPSSRAKLTTGRE